MILGVYSKKTEMSGGFGGTRMSSSTRTYWFVRRVDDDTYEVQPLNQQHVPSGIVSRISKKTFMLEYAPELDYYERKTLPVLKSLQRKLDQGEKLFELKQLDAAESEFVKALHIDEQNSQASLRLGDIYCQTKDHQRLKKALARILNLDNVFIETERHRFNEFGTNLRKGGFLDESLAYYDKALSLNDHDEHLHFNVARVFYDLKDYGKCIDHLQRALALNQDFEEAKDFLEYCRKFNT
ncbi:hypothetical protein SAMN05660653_00267 [Desulfonatronum thiosulfatophilum]|uniref:Uncharacterized protein n=1 Tax=Desulfonatronum thiosulfatophilum TaxID=617002 RepID=A0A1G6A9U2_9BACT|nr:tetratricopeptide repeat protein [Desulfonatronum thiosulfatophilum]SDB05152.1 hypothetical protein SAMN05660653_00267 [Desulfonatronum thiosulfatophilum]